MRGECLVKAFYVIYVFKLIRDVGERFGLDGRESEGPGCGRFRILRNIGNRFGYDRYEVGAVRVFDRDVEGAKDEAGATDIDVVADDSVDDLHE